ncbi:hypothetical protein GALL_553690 [mine drainage metagenome]|uniref:Uncharacterized protein n=1 Tax=mine drainage metagenome TaxID=410659 RepID=A0A1J5PHQ9_9ZZZZ
MGMLLGHNQVENPGDTVRIQGADAVTIADESAAPVTTPWNSGIGIVLPISYVLEAVNQSTLMMARQVELDAHEKRIRASDSQVGGD